MLQCTVKDNFVYIKFLMHKTKPLKAAFKFINNYPNHPSFYHKIPLKFSKNKRVQKGRGVDRDEGCRRQGMEIEKVE